MSIRIRKIIAYLIAVEFVLMGASPFISEYGKAYADSKAPGKYKVAAIAREWYYGSGEAEYKINMRKTSLKKPSGGRKKFTAKWKRLGKKYVKGYQLRYSLKKSMKKSKIKTVKSWKKYKLTVKKLKGGKRYYMQVRTYATVNGIKYYSKWSAKKSVKCRK